jgi:hypothetical protein
MGENCKKIVWKFPYKLNLKYVVSPYFRENIWLIYQNCQILKYGNQFCKIVKIYYKFYIWYKLYIAFYTIDFYFAPLN